MRKYWITSLLALCGVWWTGQQDVPPGGTTGLPGREIQTPSPATPPSGSTLIDNIPYYGSPIYPGNANASAQELQLALGRYQAATDESGERTALRNEITGLLNKQYEAHVEQYEQQIAGLESRLAKLRDHVQKRRDAKNRLVALKLELLLSQAEGMGWPEAMSSTIPQVGPNASTYQVLPGSTNYPQGQLFFAPGMSGAPPASTMTPAMMGGAPSASGTLPGLPIDPAQHPMGASLPPNYPGMPNPPATMTLPQETSSVLTPGTLPGEPTLPAPSDTVPGDTRLEYQPSPGVPNYGGASGYPSTNQQQDLPGGFPDLQPMAGAAGIGSEAPPMETLATSDSESKQALKTILLGFHNYVDAYNKFPTQAPDGHSEKLSLLVRILPYLGETDLVNRFDMTQAWDSENNLALIDRMPEILGSGRRTQVRWVESDVRQFRDITDGTSNTIACIFGGQSVYWTENRFMSMVEAVDLFNSLPPNGTLVVAMYDGSVKTLTRATTVDVFKAMLTPSRVLKKGVTG